MKPILPIGRLFSLLVLSLFSLLSQAQKTPEQISATRQHVLNDKKVKAVEISAVRQTPSLISFDEKKGSYSKNQASEVLVNYLQLRNGLDALLQDRETELFGNIEVLEFQQYFKGIKVDRAKFKALSKNGKVQFFNGAWYNVPASLSVQPKMDKSKALDHAIGRVNAKKYAWQEYQELRAKNIGNAAVLRALEKEKSEYDPKGELVIVENFNKEGIAEVQLAYKFDIYAVEPLSRAWIYVGANTGEILLVDPIIKHANNPSTSTSSVSTTVQTRYSGLRTINVLQLSGNDPNSGLPIIASNPLESYIPGALTYALVDNTKGGGIETYDLNGVGGLPLSIGPSYSQGKSFTDVNNDWTLAEHKRGTLLSENAEAENDDFAWDAHWGAGVVYDYWKLKQNRLSFDGKDAKIKSFVHSGIGYDNAFWNGRVMTYGDGSYTAARGTGFRPLTSLDVCAHEIGHGVCTFTADLVYAKESGAMNEGFSDIWAACAEYFAIINVDGSLANAYKPFYIGEQIAADPTIPLRRMDNPKARRHPDTYGGTFWKDPNCSPTLANDYCGVHTNSGVLNKWFYLMTAGSGSGSGDDGAYAGADDGINDKGNAYTVNGLGFAVSERITYLTELMLTSTATFADARNVSVGVATTLSGDPCHNNVESVTNAWYAVGVGDVFVRPCKVTYGFTLQPGSSVSEGKAGAGCNAETEVKISLVLPANSTATIATAGTATNGTDYRLSATSLSNSGSTIQTLDVSVFVKNDGVIENDETVQLTASISNTGTDNVNSNYTLNIIEDDVTPVIGNESKTLLNETFPVSNGFNSPTNWTKIDEAAGSTNKWGVWNGKLQVTAVAHETVPGPGFYDQLSATSTIAQSPEINALGLNNIKIKFDYEVQGEVEPDGVDPDKWHKYDYMSVVYSFDGVNFLELTPQEGFGHFASATIKSGTFEAILPSYFNNKKFYIGFRWYNDALVGTLVSVRLDNITLEGATRKIENEVNSSSSEKLNASQDVYFYSVQDGDVLGRLNNTSTKNFGCTGLLLTRTGNNAVLLYKGTDGDHKVSEKAIQINTEISNNKSPVTVYLYFTEAQIKALEDATGKSRNSDFNIYQTNAAALSNANATNTAAVKASYVAIPGVGGYFYATFSSKLGGSFYTIGVAPATKSGGGPKKETVGTTEISEVQYKWNIGNIYPNPARSSAFIEINSPEAKNLSVELVNLAGQLMQKQQAHIAPGTNRINVQVGSITPGAYLLRIRETNGKLLGTKQFIKE